MKRFFHRLHRIRQSITQERASLVLNRIQRNRCRQNLLDMERLERDFAEMRYRGDLIHLYRKVHRYVKLDSERLMELFGKETLYRRSLFIAL